MKNNTLVFRFRDLGTKDAIGEHGKIINEQGYVWAGWWPKENEHVPYDAMKELKRKAKESTINLLMLNSETNGIYHSIVDDIRFGSEKHPKISSPKRSHTPDYYSSSECPIWFRIREIKEPSYHDSIVERYAYEDYNLFGTAEGEGYKVYDNAIVESIKQLSIQVRTLILLRERRDSDTRISPTDEIRRIPKRDFSDDYEATESNSILMVSDLHFSTDPQRFQFADCKKGTSYAKKKLEEVICELTDRESFASLICPGDLTFYSDQEEFEKAESFFISASNNHKIERKNMVIVPGNHDMKFSDESTEPISYTEEKSKEGYINFYKKIYGIEPNKFCAVGRKILLKNRLPVEIVGLNSNCLQQEMGHFVGMGFVGDEQLSLVEDKMGWSSKSNQTYAYRILVLHHYLYPVELVQEPERDYGYSMCLDAGLITSFIIRNKINLVIHGHKHKKHFLQVGDMTNEGSGLFSLLGLGSASSSDVSMDERNSIGILDFNEFGTLKIKLYDISSINNKDKKCSFMRTLPLWTRGNIK